MKLPLPQGQSIKHLRELKRSGFGDNSRVPKFQTTLPHGGGGGIRTPETLSGLTVFKTAAFNHSATPPFLIVAYPVG